MPRSQLIIEHHKPLVAMACLAHDLGNPPFGHFGEKVLNQLMVEYGGFEGNAQTIRIVCDLENKSSHYNGLNLTLASRLALVKYNVTAEQKSRESSLLDGKFIYDEHRDIVQGIEELRPQSLECKIMELADDIAYAAHDLEDSLKSGVLSLDEIQWSLEQKPDNVLPEFETMMKKAAEYSGTTSGDTFHKALTSVLIHEFVNDIGVVLYSEEDKKKKGTHFNKGLGFLQYEGLLKKLKSSVYNLLVNRPSVAEYEIKGGLMLEQLFTMLIDKKYNSDYRLFPLEYQGRIRDRLDKAPSEEGPGILRRAACDYISGMTDAFARRLYTQHFGKELPGYMDSSKVQ